MDTANANRQRSKRIERILGATSFRHGVIATLLDTAETNPEAAKLLCDEFFSPASRTARVTQILPAVVGYAMAAPMVENVDKRERFFRLSFFKERSYSLKEDNLLRYAIMYARGSHRGSIAQQARREAGAMQENFDNIVLVDEVFRQLIHEGGFKSMADRTVANRSGTVYPQPRAASTVTDDHTESDQIEDFDGPYEDFAYDTPGCAIAKPEDEIRSPAQCRLNIPSHLRSRCASLEYNVEIDMRVKKVRDLHGNFAFELIEV